LEPKGFEGKKHWLKTTWGGDNEFDADGYRRDLNLSEINKDPETHVSEDQSPPPRP
jgi:hypothetical protein